MRRGLPKQWRKEGPIINIKMGSTSLVASRFFPSRARIVIHMLVHMIQKYNKYFICGLLHNCTGVVFSQRNTTGFCLHLYTGSVWCTMKVISSHWTFTLTHHELRASCLLIRWIQRMVHFYCHKVRPLEENADLLKQTSSQRRARRRVDNEPHCLCLTEQEEIVEKLSISHRFEINPENGEWFKAILAAVLPLQLLSLSSSWIIVLVVVVLVVEGSSTSKQRETVWKSWQITFIGSASVMSYCGTKTYFYSSNYFFFSVFLCLPHIFLCLIC